MLRLVGCAVLHALAAVCTALLVGRLVGSTAGQVTGLVVLLTLALGGMGASKYAERVLSERLGQDYVHELRGRLASLALTGDDKPSLGITIARTTNDLSSVRSWVAQGIAPLIAALPLVVGSVVALGWLHWSLAAATLLPLLALAAALAGISRLAYRRARTLRRRRGRLAARLSDTLHAREAILTAGGHERELRRINHDSRRVVDAAIARSRTAGALQALALTTAAAIAALVALAGRTAGVDTAAVASALTIAGVLAAPLADTGRIVEFRQNYRAARRILGPHLAADHPRPPLLGERQRCESSHAVQVSLSSNGTEVLSFTAQAGDRLHVVGADQAETSAALRQIAAPNPSAEATVIINGWDHVRSEPRHRRELVGIAARGTPLEPGTIARAVRYRRPDLDPTHTQAALERVGLDSTLADQANGERTKLRRGGDPLTTADLARLKIARAIIGEPPLLLLDHIDSELDSDGKKMVAQVVADYPGVVLFASDHPHDVATNHLPAEIRSRDVAATTRRAG